MNFFSPTEIKKLLNNHGVRVSKRLGQNFLINESVLKKIIDASDIQPADTVLEIGPGIGTLTQSLARYAQQVIAIEKDSNMVAILQDTLHNFSNTEIIHADALHYILPIALYRVVANIPYYLTSPLIRKFLEAENQPQSLTLMVQKEVAQRICAKPPHMSLLAVSVQFYAQPKIISYVKKESFWPKPKVDSAIISIIPTVNRRLADAEQFFAVAKAGFSHPRKQLKNNFSTTFKKSSNEIQCWLLKNRITPTRRAETLSIEDWLRLSSDFPPNHGAEH